MSAFSSNASRDASDAPKGGLSSGRHHAASLQLPVPKRTGNQLVDAEAGAIHEQFMTMVDHCIRDPSHVVPLFSVLTHRLTIQSAAPESKGADMFTNAPKTIASLANGEYEEWLLDFLVSLNDCTASDVMGAVKPDDDAALQMLQYATGSSPALKFPSCCQIKALLAAILRTQCISMGTRLESFKGGGGFASNGALAWIHGCYSLQTVDGVIIGCTHTATKHIKDISSFGLKVSYQLCDNWSDVSAALVQAPLPPIKLASFFDLKAKHGPWSQPAAAVVAKQFEKLCAEAYQEWADEGSQLGQSCRSVRASTGVGFVSHGEAHRGGPQST